MLLVLVILSFLFLRPRTAAQNQPNELINTAPLAQASLVIPEPVTEPVKEPVKPKSIVTPKQTIKTSVKANGKIAPEKLKAWLQTQKGPRGTGSPLADYSELILQSEYWSTIIGICFIEQYACTSAPSWNYWGLMKSGGGLMKFATAELAIAEIDRKMKLYEGWWGTNIQDWRGHYCSSACTNWEPTVIKIKNQVENL